MKKISNRIVKYGKYYEVIKSFFRNIYDKLLVVRQADFNVPYMTQSPHKIFDRA